VIEFERLAEFLRVKRGKQKLEAVYNLIDGGHGRLVSVRPNVRVKPAPTAWCAGQQAQTGPQAQRLMAGVPRCWGSA